jgi:hypothetical protein
MTLPRITLIAACVSLAASTGCSSSKPLADGAAGASGAGGAGNTPQCMPPGYHMDSAAIEVDEVKARLSDPSGAVVPNLPIQVCGTNTCTYDSSNAQGVVDTTQAAMLVLPAFKYGDGRDFAELAVPIRKSKQDLGDIVVLPLPGYADGAAFPKSGPVSNGDLTLFIDSTTSVVHDVLNYEDDSQLVLRTVSIPIAQSQQALPDSFGFELAFGVAPLGSTFCPAARLSLKNSLNWDAGTQVEIFVQGVDTDEAWAPYGSWTQVAEGSVSDDGSSIDTTSGGIPILSAIAVRRK